MTTYAVKREDLDAAVASARTQASQILDQVNQVQTELARTTFVGEVAESLAEEMNAKMSSFVTITYENVNSLMELIVNNMNVVVTKLGGQPWANTPVTGAGVTQASTMRGSANADYEIDTEEMSGFANRVDGWFEDIVTSYQDIGRTIADGTPGWQGPEKTTSVNAVNSAVTEIVGSPGGGTGVRGVGSSLSGLLRDQVSLMSS